MSCINFKLLEQFALRRPNPNFHRLVRNVSTIKSTERKCKLLVIGGGSGGCSVASKFAPKLGSNEVIIVEPSDKHYYQPMFTLVGGGMNTLDDCVQPMKTVLPKNADWIQDSVGVINAKENNVITDTGIKINYDYLVVATGITLNYEKIPGLEKALSMADSGVCSNYSPRYVDRTFKALKDFKQGNLVFTFPNTPIKCAGAPQKICYIAEHYLRLNGKRKDANLIYNTSLGVIFGVKKYADALWKVCNQRGIQVNLRTNLIEVVPEKRIARFQNLDKPDLPPMELEYSLLHVTPPMSPPSVLQSCDGLSDSAGYLDVNKDTLQHKLYDNIFGIGDSTNLPTSKTAAAVAAQSGVLANNLSQRMAGLAPNASYDGYTSCPLVTGYSSCILAEFDYQLKPLETFPVAQDKERKSMFILKKVFMPFLYWNAMLRGLWNGPAAIRNLLRGKISSS